MCWLPDSDQLWDLFRPFSSIQAFGFESSVPTRDSGGFLRLVRVRLFLHAWRMFPIWGPIGFTIICLETGGNGFVVCTWICGHVFVFARGRAAMVVVVCTRTCGNGFVVCKSTGGNGFVFCTKTCSKIQRGSTPLDMLCIWVCLPENRQQSARERAATWWGQICSVPENPAGVVLTKLVVLQ